MDRRMMLGGATAAAVTAVSAAAWKTWASNRSLVPIAFAQEPPKKEGFAAGRDPLAGVKDVPFDQERCLKYVKQFCDLGPRISGTDALKKQLDVMVKHFETFGGKVTKQEFQAKQRSRRDKTPMTNLIVSWYPDKPKRVILCCHYDTRPVADQEAERANWNRPFVSANDGTAGVALMMELAHHMKTIAPAVGVDFVFFDGEEYVFDTNPVGGDDYFLGSEHFAREYAANKAKLGYAYDGAMLFDLCCHEGAVLRVEMYSWQFANPLVQTVWKLAEACGAKSFRFERGDEVRDDHLALNAVRIPAVDVIDFNYPHWHKLSDTVDKISGKQCAEVAKVAMAWVQTAK
jgi:glutaminyl-peptide cyclotransferase